MFKVRLKNKTTKYERTYVNVTAKDAMEAHTWGEKQAQESGPLSDFIVEVLGTIEAGVKKSEEKGESE